jgi:hypothetical protein
MFANTKTDDFKEWQALPLAPADPFVHPCSMTLPQLKKLTNQNIRMEYNGAIHKCRIEQVSEDNSEVIITCLRFSAPGSRDKVNVSQGMVLVSREPVTDLFAELFPPSLIKTGASS